MKISILLLAYCVTTVHSYINVTVPEDGKMNFTQLARKYGRRIQEYDVTTEDGYILKLFNIPGDRSKSVLLVHGIIDSADTFIIRGPKSVAVMLAERGYDVWALATRGARYSRRHTILNPDTDREFWNFSFHEIGTYDLAATIDFILQETSQKQLSAIGHSQGTQVFYVLGATRPDYNNKITVFISLAPICFVHNVKPPVDILVQTSYLINKMLLALNQEEVMNSDLSKLVTTFCLKNREHLQWCLKQILFQVAGSDPEEFEEEFVLVLLGHYPSSTSRKNADHLSQIAKRKTFAYYDYGKRNLEMYNSTQPPAYDLSKVTMKVALFVGRNDKLSTVKDVRLLRKRLPNVVKYEEMKRKQFNHMDFLWGRNTIEKYVFPNIITVLQKYT